MVSGPLKKGKMFSTPVVSDPPPPHQHHCSENRQTNSSLVAHTVDLDKGKQQRGSVLEPVSLQEACELLKPEFVRRSENRQRKIKERVREPCANKNVVPTPAPPEPCVRSRQFIPMGKSR